MSGGHRLTKGIPGWIILTLFMLGSVVVVALLAFVVVGGSNILLTRTKASTGLSLLLIIVIVLYLFTPKGWSSKMMERIKQ